MRVSVVIITRNRVLPLEKCLRSLTRQTNRPHEVIVVNNQSRDKTQMVIKKYQRRLRIKPLVIENRNIPFLYNQGILLSKGDVIACLDDDCVAKPDWIKNIIAVRQQFPQAVIQGEVTSVPRGNLYVTIMSEHYRSWLAAHRISKNQLSVLDTKNVSFPAHLIKANLFSTDLYLGSHDIELGKRLTQGGIPIIYTPLVKVYHRERATVKNFLWQHWRIARSEALLNKISTAFKVEVLFSRKNYLSFLWLMKYWKQLFVSGRIGTSAYLIFLYLSLIVVRLGGYVYEGIAFNFGPRLRK